MKILITSEASSSTSLNAAEHHSIVPATKMCGFLVATLAARKKLETLRSAPKPFYFAFESENRALSQTFSQPTVRSSKHP